MTATVQSKHRPLSSPRGGFGGCSQLMLLLVALVGTECGRLMAGEPMPPGVVETDEPGVYKIGEVTLRQASRTVEIPAQVNMEKGTVEYLLVNADGKTHESVLRTKAQPYQIQIALLLLGAKKSPTGDDGGGSGQIDAAGLQSAPDPVGDPLTLEVLWRDEEGVERRVPAEALLVRSDGVPVERGPWLYTGSFFHGNEFAAQVEGSIASLVLDPVAMINNPKPGNRDDLLWNISEAQVPPKDSAVTLVVRFEERGLSTPSEDGKVPDGSATASPASAGDSGPPESLSIKSTKQSAGPTSASATASPSPHLPSPSPVETERPQP